MEVDVENSYDEPTIVHQKPKKSQQTDYKSSYFDGNNDVEMQDLSPAVISSQSAVTRRNQRPQHEFKLTPLNTKLLSDIVYRGTHFYLRSVKDSLNFVEIIARGKHTVSN